MSKIVVACLLSIAFLGCAQPDPNDRTLIKCTNKYTGEEFMYYSNEMKIVYGIGCANTYKFTALSGKRYELSEYEEPLWICEDFKKSN